MLEERRRNGIFKGRKNREVDKLYQKRLPNDGSVQFFKLLALVQHIKSPITTRLTIPSVQIGWINAPTTTINLGCTSNNYFTLLQRPIAMDRCRIITPPMATIGTIALGILALTQNLMCQLILPPQILLLAGLESLNVGIHLKGRKAFEESCRRKDWITSHDLHYEDLDTSIFWILMGSYNISKNRSYKNTTKPSYTKSIFVTP